MLNSNCNRGRHFHHVVGYWQTQCLSFLGCISACRRILVPTQLLDIWRQCEKCNNTHNKSQKMSECQTHGWILCSFHIWDLEWSLTFYPRRIASIVLQLMTSLNAHVRTSPKCCHELWGEKENGCIANTYTMSSDFYVRQITKMTSSFMLRRIPSTRLCDYLSLLALLNASNDGSIMDTHLFEYVKQM